MTSHLMRQAGLWFLTASIVLLTGVDLAAQGLISEPGVTVPTQKTVVAGLITTPGPYGIADRQSETRAGEFYRIQTVIEGQVRDADTNQPLPGVNIVVQGTTTGTVTDAAGNYSLNVPSLNETLIISYIGYESQEVQIAGRSTIDFSLQAIVLTGQEMVVTAFGIARQERSISYSTQGVSTSELAEARELNVMSSLQGRVSGMTVTTSGTGVGAPARVILRGNRSISGDSQPLYVIDGVPVRGQPAELNPDNIASINVLKGPNAAALYGSAAQNGAIIIETHRARQGVVQVSMNNTFLAARPDIRIPFQNEYGQGVGGVYNRTSDESWGPRMEGQMVDHWSPNPELAGMQYAFTPQPDNIIDAFQTGYNLSSNLQASIGGENTQTVFSYTGTTARDITPNNELRRSNIFLRNTSQLTSRFSLDSKLEYTWQTIDNPIFTGETPRNPYRNIYRMPRNILTDHVKEFQYIDADGVIRQNYWNPGSTSGRNPYWIMNRDITEQKRERVNAMAALSFDLTEELSIMARGGYDTATTNSENRAWVDNYGSALQQGYFLVSRSEAAQLDLDALLSYTTDISEDWSINGNLGASLQRLDNSALSGNTGRGLLVPNFFALSNTPDPQNNFNPGASVETQSVYAFGQVGYRDLIYLDITGRNDWSSTLPADSRSYFYPSVGLSVILSDIISLPAQFSYASLKASWARVGSSAPPHMLNRTASFQAGGNRGYLSISGILPNTDLRPEQTESIEAGFDFRFYEGRLGLALTGYKTNTTDQLFTINLPLGSGSSQFFTNGGDVQNIGFEATLSATPLQTISSRWDMFVNFDTNRNTVESISDERPRIVIGGDFYTRDFVVEQGQNFGDVYSRGWVRDDQGRVIVGSDGMPQFTPGQTVKVANYKPDWRGSISNTFTWRNMSASFLIEHRQGGTLVSMTNAILYGDGVHKETLAGREGGLIFGQNVFEDEEAVLADGTPNNIEISSQSLWRGIGGRNTPVGEAFVEDATTTRLREVTIGYSLPASVISQLPVSNIKVSLVGRNLLFIYQVGDWDPDILTDTNPVAEGFQSFSPPTSRTFGMNLKIDF